MSVGQVGDQHGDREAPDPLAERLQPGEEVRLSWTATGVRWANQWNVDTGTPTAFAATDRRVLFETADGATSIGYNRVRAVNVEPPRTGPDLSTAFIVFGGLCLVVGLVAATRDPLNGFGLAGLAVALLVAGYASSEDDRSATVTIIVGNERQRLSFSVDEEVGSEFAELARGK